jgi:hypothetical protein
MIHHTEGRHGGFPPPSSGVAQERGGVPHGPICRPWSSVFEGRTPVCARHFPHGVLLMKERFEGRWPHLLARLDRGPTEQPIADEARAAVIQPGEALRHLGVQHRRPPRAEPGASMEQATSVCHARGARPCRGLRWSPGLAPVPMREAPLEPGVGLPRLILRVAGRARFTLLGQGGRVNGRGPQRRRSRARRGVDHATAPARRPSAGRPSGGATRWPRPPARPACAGGEGTPACRSRRQSDR